MDPIETFLDAADRVLNSNTFLVALPMPTGIPLTDLGAFIRSGRLQDAIFAADITRGWYNFHRFGNGDILTPVPGNLATPDFRLTERASRCTPSEYLGAMLRGDRTLGDFVSFYGKAVTPEEAGHLTRQMMGRLFAGREPALHVLEPDFLRGQSEEADEAWYFEGKSCDNAALFVVGQIGYLLLTNGAP